MLCEDCYLNGTCNPIFPSGSDSPDFYVIGDLATQYESDANQVFSINYPAGQYLMNTMMSLGMTAENTRVFKTIRCYQKTYTEDNEALRSRCGVFATMDIYKHNPKIIIALGSEVSKYFIKDKFSYISNARGRIYDVEINGKMFKVMPTYSPNYVVNNPNQAESFTNDLLHAISYVNGELIDIAQKDLQYAQNYEEFKTYFDEHLANAEMPSYDLETNARDPRSQEARMVGFSLAPDGSTGIYVVRNSLEYKMPEEDWKKIVSLVIEKVLKQKKVLVHNCMYEIPFTENEWQYYIQNFEDSLIKARLLLGGKIGAGLKDQCIKNLGYPDWDSDLDMYKSAFMQLLGKLKPTPGGRNRWDLDFIRNRGLVALYDEYERILNESGLDARCTNNYNAVSRIRDVCLKYYTTEAEYAIIMELVGEEIVALIDAGYSGPFSYGFIPMKVITKYGAMDSVGTQDLNEYLDKQIADYSKQLGIDLRVGYDYMKRHYIAGTWMEMNGLYWNNEVAEQEKAWYAEQCLKSELAMIDSPFLDETLFREQRWIFNDYLVENNLDLVRAQLGDFDIMKSGIKLRTTGELIKFKDILERMGKEFIDYNRTFMLQLIRSKAREHKDYKELKYMFNPASPKQSTKDLINSILVTDEIRVAYLMNKLNVMLDDPEFDLQKYPMSDRPLFQVLIDGKKYNKYVDEYNKRLDDDENDKDIMEELQEPEFYSDAFLNGVDSEDEDDESGKGRKVKLTTGDLFQKFVETFSKIQLRSREIQLLASEALNYRLDSVSEGNIIELNSYYVISGVVLDDQSTWTDRYWFLVNFRMWKKCNKMITTYIDGRKVGRGSVWIVDEADLDTGELLTRRKRLYDGLPNEGECCIMQPTYKVCTANSFRWQAGMHTIPAESSIKNIYTSRYEGGCIAAPDFSQMELRTMAGASQCTAMIEAFRAGADIHMQNACKIFKKKPEDVTSAERRYSKMASFMILYGGDYRNFGEEFLDGDIKLAKYIYDSFYEAYPEVAQYIEAKHEEMKKYGKVTTLMNMFLSISPDDDVCRGDEGKALRIAQNAPIQSAASMIAGCCLYEIMKFIVDHNMKSKIILFVHDSIEVDIHPAEMLQLASQIVPMMNKFPNEQFNMPVKADLVLGKSIGQEVTIEEIHCNEDFTEGEMVCEAYEHDFMALMNEWKKVYKSVTWEDIDEPKVKYKSWSGLWISKLAVQKGYGINQTVVHRRVKVII